MAVAGGRGRRALINVSADNLGAVIKILSRWEVNRNDFNKTPGLIRASDLGSSFFPSSSLYFGVGAPHSGTIPARGKVVKGAKQASGKPRRFPSGGSGRKSEQNRSHFFSIFPLAKIWG